MVIGAIQMKYLERGWCTILMSQRSIFLNKLISGYADESCTDAATGSVL